MSKNKNSLSAFKFIFLFVALWLQEKEVRKGKRRLTKENVVYETDLIENSIFRIKSPIFKRAKTQQKKKS